MSYYQTILQPGLSTVITVLQGFGVVVPFTLAGIFWMGLPGVCAAAVVSEAFTILLCVLYRMGGQKTGRFPSGGRYMLPEIVEETYLDFSIENHMEDVIKLRDVLFAFCGENNIREKDAKLIGLALEEICANIVRYGYQGDKRNFNKEILIKGILLISALPFRTAAIFCGYGMTVYLLILWNIRQKKRKPKRSP